MLKHTLNLFHALKIKKTLFIFVNVFNKVHKMLKFNKSGIPEMLKTSILRRAGLQPDTSDIFGKLHNKLDNWYDNNHEKIKSKISNLKKSKSDHIADSKCLNRWWGNEKIKPMSITEINMNLLCLYAEDMSWDEYNKVLTEEERNFYIEDNSNQLKEVIKNENSQLNYFKNYTEKVEPILEDEAYINFTRSFNLLLYMFGNEVFKEFRAFDMAFNRWYDILAENEKNNSFLNIQIKNIAKAILLEIECLGIQKRCKNFRRICVIPNIKIVIPDTINVIKIFSDLEKRIINSLLKLENLKQPEDLNIIFETRLLICKTNEYDYIFNELNDFAMFSDVEEFAIIETSLTDPYETNNSRVCKIITDKKKLKSKKDRFDWLWDYKTTKIQDFLNEYDTTDKSNSIQQIINHLKSNINNVNQASLIIETAYVELINIVDKNRITHYRDAFELIRNFPKHQFFDNIKENIFLDAFIGDFNHIKCIKSTSIDESRNDLKQSESSEYNTLNNSIKNTNQNDYLEKCTFPENYDTETSKKLKNSLTHELNSRNISYIINNEHVKSFYMTSTRNKVVKRLKHIINDLKKQHLFEFEETNDKLNKIYIKDRFDKKIYIGYKKDSIIIPNCTLLMAEHYYELFEFGYIKKPSQKEIWIIDFLQYFEVDSAELGMEVAYILFQWESGISVNVVNCNYSDNNFIGIRHLGPYKF